MELFYLVVGLWFVFFVDFFFPTGIKPDSEKQEVVTHPGWFNEIKFEVCY